MRRGHVFIWRAGREPYFVSPDCRIISSRVCEEMPYLVSGDSSYVDETSENVDLGARTTEVKNNFFRQAEIAARPVFAARVLYGCQPGRGISARSRGKPGREPFDFHGSWASQTKTVLKCENNGSQKHLGQQKFENGRGRRCFARLGPNLHGNVSARIAPGSRRQ